jgi:hypothetical protein
LPCRQEQFVDKDAELSVRADAHPKDYLKRLAWLLACVVIGLAIALVGNSIFASSVWYVAIPAVVAVGWLFFADLSQCEPGKAKRSGSIDPTSNAPP